MISMNILVKTMPFYLESFHRYGVLKDVNFFLAHPAFYISGRGDICADVEKSDCPDGIGKSIELCDNVASLAVVISGAAVYVYV